MKAFPRNTFKEYLSKDHFKNEVLSNYGNESFNLFAINTLRKSPTLVCTTGCLPLYEADSSFRFGVRPVVLLTRSQPTPNTTTSPISTTITIPPATTTATADILPTGLKVEKVDASEMSTTTTPLAAAAAPPKRKRARQVTQVYQTSSPVDVGFEVKTRSGRLSKRPQNVLIMVDDDDNAVEDEEEEEESDSNESD